MEWAISVWNCRAAVVRRIDSGDGKFTFQEIPNWKELEDKAVEAVEAQGGAINLSGLYPCPDALIALATGETPENDDDCAGE